LLVGCTTSPPVQHAPPAQLPVVAPSPTASAAETDVDAPELVLPIPARSQAPESPPSGWCGETAIQEGLLHLGLFVPQRAINRAGHPVHADLYATEIPGALDALHVKYTSYPGARGYEPFKAWAIKSLAAGHPVLAGVKLVPSEHPSWGLDHFVLVVGHGKRGLLVNTTWGRRAWVAEDGASGLSFKGAFYGFRFDDIRGATDLAHLAVLDEAADEVKLRIACDSAEMERTIPSDKPAKFRCPLE
jgi:hypothetical protein